MGSTPSSELDTLPDGHAGEGSSRGYHQPRPARTTRSHLVSLGKAHNKFALQVYQEIAKDGKRPGNVVFCPLAVGLGIGLLYIGSKGNTHDEIRKVMYLQEVTDKHLMPAFAAMHWDFVRSSVPKGCTLEVAIRIFIPAEHTMTPSYEIVCNNYELSWLSPVDFVNRHDLARKEINGWVMEHTHGKITEAIPLSIVDRDTKVLLLCAVYVKVQWLYQFDIKKTSKASFYLPMKETLQVQMMYQQRTIRHCHCSKLDSDIIELPFANYHLKCYLILPKKADGLGKMESKLSRSVLDTTTSVEAMSEQVVDIFLPKYTYEQGLPYGDLVHKAGIRDLFNNSGKADLSGLDGTNSLYLSRLYHHIYFEFDEGGTNVTAGSSHDAGSHITKASKTFRADHPFVFFIRDDRTEAIFFIGRVVRPVLA